MRQITKAELDKVMEEIVQEAEDEHIADEEDWSGLTQEEVMQKVIEKLGTDWELV